MGLIRALRLPLSLLTAALLAAGLSQCGHKDKKETTSPQAPGVSAVPSDWDGAADWSGSSWKVIEE